MSDSRVVYNPPARHECELPAQRLALRDGAIARCAKCRAYHEMRSSRVRSGTWYWQRLDPLTVIGYMLIGRIPTAQADPAKKAQLSTKTAREIEDDDTDD